MVSDKGRYTKHYYAGPSKIATRVRGLYYNDMDEPPCDDVELEVLKENQKTDLVSSIIALYGSDVQYTITNNYPLVPNCSQLIGDAKIQCECKELVNSGKEPELLAAGLDEYNSCLQLLYYYHTDHLGSSTFITDNDGRAYQFLLYLPYGETMVDQKVGPYATPYQYTGQELDAKTGLYNYGARYYDPRISQFMSVDPLADIKQNQGWNPYHYVHNNPINLIDPTGMKADSIPYISDVVVPAFIEGAKAYKEIGSRIYDFITSPSEEEETEPQQHKGTNVHIFGNGSPNGWSITGDSPDPNGDDEFVDISDMHTPGKGNKGKWIGLTGSDELKNVYNIVKSVNKALNAVDRISGQEQVPINDTIYNCEACNGAYIDSSGVKIRTTPNGNKPQKTIKTHY